MNGKGMVATLDAVIFVTVLAVASMMLFTAVPHDGPEGPDASGICDSVSRITLSSELIAEGSGDRPMNVWDMCAVSIASGDTEFVENYLGGVIGDILTDRYGYVMRVEYRGTVLEFGEGRGNPVSECMRDIDTVGGIVSVSLTVYG